MGTGVFPDATDCKKYYYCSDDGAGEIVADRFECDDYYVFDPSGPGNEFCRLTMNRFCTQVKCDDSFKNILLQYQFFPITSGSYIATCQPNKKPIVTRCEAGFIPNLTTVPVDCELVCRAAAKLPFPGDDMKYYECVFNGRNWEAKVKSCYRNYYFDAKTKLCEMRNIASTTAPAST